MTTQATESNRKSTGEGKAELLRVLIIAVVSFLAGFALIFFFLKPSGPDVPEAELPSSPEATTSDAPTPSATTPPPAPVAPAPLLPAGPTAATIRLSSDTRVQSCWDDSGVERSASACDNLPELGRRLVERLYVAEQCIEETGGLGDASRMEILCEVDFGQGSASFWTEASPSARGGADLADCLRTRMRGFPIEGISHQLSRYRLSFEVEPVVATPAAAASEEVAAAVPSAPPPGDGKLVSVVKTQVRVRRTRPDGEIIGKISPPNQVRLISREDEWCQVVTPNNNTGWMICDALGL